MATSITARGQPVSDQWPHMDNMQIISLEAGSR